MAAQPANEAPHRLIRDVEFGQGVVVYSFTNLYGCEIGDWTRVGPFVEIQAGVKIGARCKIQSHTFVCSGVTLDDEVFVGHGVLFINDKRPRAAVVVLFLVFFLMLPMLYYMRETAKAQRER